MLNARELLDIIIISLNVDVLENGADDFQSSDEVYEAVGEVLQEVASDKTEEDIR